MKSYAFLLNFSICILLLGVARISRGAQGESPAQDVYPLAALAADSEITYLVNLYNQANLAQYDQNVDKQTAEKNYASAIAAYKCAVAEHVQKLVSAVQDDIQKFVELQTKKAELQEQYYALFSVFSQSDKESQESAQKIGDFRAQKKVELDVVNGQIARLLNKLVLPKDKQIDEDTISDSTFQKPYYEAVQQLSSKHPDAKIRKVIEQPKSSSKIIIGDREKVLNNLLMKELVENDPVLKKIYAAMTTERPLKSEARTLNQSDPIAYIIKQQKQQIEYEKPPESQPKKQNIDYGSWAKKLAVGGTLAYLGYAGVKESLGGHTYLGNALVAAKYSLFPKSIQSLVKQQK